MSSTNPLTTTATAISAANSRQRQQTYWCHECDMSFSLLITPPPLLTITCPHCNGEFIEEMDSPLFSPNPNPNLSPPHHHRHPFHPTLTPTTDDDNFHLPSNFHLSDAFLLDRLIQHLTDTDNDDTVTTTTTTNFHVGGSYPTSKACVDTIPTIKITASFLNSDTMLCAVCKDEFIIDVEAKQLPCNHIYHCECILPWLEQHNSCPVCRFSLPVEENVNVRVGRAGRARGVIRFGNLMDEDDQQEDDEEEMFGVGSTLRHIVRRHRIVFPARSTVLGSSSSPTQMAQAETSGVSAGPANSGETVSSRPFDVGRTVGGSGSGRLDEDGDVVMSEVRDSLFD